MLEAPPLVNDPREFIVVILSNFNKEIIAAAGFDPDDISASRIGELAA